MLGDVLQLKSFLKIGRLPLASMLGLVLFVFVAGAVYFSLQQESDKARSQKMADTLVQYFKSEIHHRASVLKVIGEQLGTFDQKTFDRVAKSIVEEYPYFHAINFVEPSGIIERVYPREPNVLALGQKLLDRPDVKDYLKESEGQQVPFMSHRLKTYQGIPAYTMYVPLRAADGKFIGWLNAVVDFDSWLKASFDLLNLGDAGFLISWEHADSEPLLVGAKDIERPFAYSYQILNQNLRFEVGFEGDLSGFEGKKNFLILIFTGIILILTGFVLIVRASFSEQRLSEVNANLKLKQSLLSALTHDISSPLTSIGFILELSAEQNQPLSDQDKTRIQKCMTSIEEMLMATKLLHSKGSSQILHMLRPVKIESVLSEAISLVRDHLEAKGIQVEVKPFDKNICVIAEPRTLCNNVLVNLLTNAVKFSAQQSKIFISLELDKDRVLLKVEDQGVGWSPEQLNRFASKQALESTLGTIGEQGSGLGVFQVQSFMELYGGSVHIENRQPQGSCVRLCFKAATVAPAV